MNVKLMILPVVLAVGMASIYFLPSVGAVADSAVRMELPTDMGGWILEKQAPSEAEILALSKDTEFSKAICLRSRPGEITPEGRLVPDRLDLSIVLSGTDINNSIHRPERCLPAQGHENLVGSDVLIRIPNGKTVTARKLTSMQRIPTSEDRKSNLEMRCVTYYFFVGHDQLAHGHWQRTFIDMKDRIIRGMDQRWAYISVSMWVGKMPWNPDVEITEKEADEKAVRFLSEFAEKQIDWKAVTAS